MLKNVDQIGTANCKLGSEQEAQLLLERPTVLSIADNLCKSCREFMLCAIDQSVNLN